MVSMKIRRNHLERFDNFKALKKKSLKLKEEIGGIGSVFL